MGDRVAVMKAGILQEVGEPQYLYDYPANIFVGGFIGSPPDTERMHFFDPGTGAAIRG